MTPHPLRLMIRTKLWDREPAATVELPEGASALIYAAGDFAAAQLNGITPAQLHDAIGCPQANTYSLLVKAARQLVNAWRTSQLSADDYDHLAEQLAALDKAPEEPR